MTKHTRPPVAASAKHARAAGPVVEALKLVTHRTQSRFGWQPDLPDHRDQVYSAPPPPAAGLPNSVDLRSACPPVYDQGDLGSCTANAIAAALEFDRKKQKLPDFVPSRLFIYYNERVMEGTVDSDSGAQIRDGIKSVAKLGAPPETEWPYVNIETTFSQQPPAAAYADAKKDRALRYQRVVRTLQQMQGCLASGYGFVFGFTVYQSFMTPQVAQTGVMPMPGPTENKVGGHAVMAVGYDTPSRMMIVRNSWGTGWGKAGYFMMPFEFITSPNCSDFWTIKSVGPN